MPGKKYKKAAESLDQSKKYSIKDAIDLAIKAGFAKFDESVDVAINLGIDAKQTDQAVRGAVVLPHGVGKTARVVAFAKGEKAKEAEAAGADVVGADDLAQRISEGWLDFDNAIATPDMMGVVSKVAKILGPRGMMPNPKLGTVTMDVTKTIKELKLGRVEFRSEKGGIIHCSVGRKSFGTQKIYDNVASFISALAKFKPATSKGNFLTKMAISTTMGPALRVEISEVSAIGAKS